MPRRAPSRPRFKRPRRTSRIGDWWLIWRMPVLLLVVMAVWWFIVRPINAEQGWERVSDRFAICAERGEREAGCVVDGDTVVLGFGAQPRRIRLTGFDAPELDGACEAERALARRARTHLHEWLAKGPFEWDGADGPPRDQYGRELREARRKTGDNSYEFLAETMVEDGLAGESGWGASPRNWCA